MRQHPRLGQCSSRFDGLSPQRLDSTTVPFTPGQGRRRGERLDPGRAQVTRAWQLQQGGHPASPLSEGEPAPQPRRAYQPEARLCRVVLDRPLERSPNIRDIGIQAAQPSGPRAAGQCWLCPLG